MRIAAKTASYSVMHITVAFLVAYALTGNAHLAMGISLIEPLVQTGFFYLHERLWNAAPEVLAPRTYS